MKEEAALENQYQMMRQQCQQLTYKINELKMDADEHDLVIEALKPLDKDRKCFRMVDAIVVERTVSDVLPAVQKNKDQMAATMETLENKLKEMQAAADEFRREHEITVRDQQVAQQEEESEELPLARERQQWPQSARHRPLAKVEAHVEAPAHR